MYRITASAGFEEQNGDLANIEVDVMFFFMRNEGAEESPHNAMPSAQIFLHECVFDETGDFFIIVGFVQS